MPKYICKVIDFNISDHKSIYTIYKHKFRSGNKKHKTIKYWCSKDFDVSKCEYDLSIAPWSVVDCMDNTDDILSVWTTIFNNILDIHAPLKEKKSQICQTSGLVVIRD